ncbi:hypothetical protein ACFQ48_16820 [Hymenobacter caeli]|uniref:Phospholipase D-like domain-containing protein n=1 Tax=Hymenobacter caeli TaxID=2735894 RepID=A0ABX2FSN0_9BACT|nr:hypothetical protein [Hymenobacter caeli]NRT19369.1 hypothetical protein [Hymenobacter caeli]
MKIIQSHDIQSKLMDVILKAKKELVIVSPYVNLTYSKQVSAALIAARNRGVSIDFYIRDDATNHLSKEQVLSMGITPRLIPNLHAKLYFNELTGIISSLNLLSSSIGNSIEIGGQLETAEELDELRLFITQFIAPHEVGRAAAPDPNAWMKDAAKPPIKKTQTPEIKHSRQQEFGSVLADFLAAKVDRNTHIDGHQDGSLTIRAVGNTFTVQVENTRLVSNQLALIAVVSGSEADRFLAKASAHFTSPDYVRFIQRGGKGHYDLLKATRKEKLSAKSLEELPQAEKQKLLPEIAKFLKEVQAYKADYRS